MGLAAPRPLSENLTYLPCVSLAEIFTGVYYFLPLCPTLVASIFFLVCQVLLNLIPSL